MTFEKRSWSETVHVNLCGFLQVTEDLFAISACTVDQDEAAADCRCCCSGCGQLCQHFSGRVGVPCLENQVWWVSPIKLVSFFFSLLFLLFLIVSFCDWQQGAITLHQRRLTAGKSGSTIANWCWCTTCWPTRASSLITLAWPTLLTWYAQELFLPLFSCQLIFSVWFGCYQLAQQITFY